MERPLWAEQRPENWWDAAVLAVRGVLAEAGVPGSQVKGIGLSGQMHGLVMMDGSGSVIRPSLIWCDQRSQAQVDAVNAQLGRENILRYIANPVLTGFTLPKLLWVRDNEPHNFAPHASNAVAQGTMSVFCLTGEFATEVSDASGTRAVRCRQSALVVRDGRWPRARSHYLAQMLRIERGDRQDHAASGGTHGPGGGYARGGRRAAIRRRVLSATASSSLVSYRARWGHRAWCSRTWTKSRTTPQAASIPSATRSAISGTSWVSPRARV